MNTQTATPMKKRHFVFSFVKRTTSRMYGGENYTLAVYENKGPGCLIPLGTVTGCTRGHKGFESEAWALAWEKGFTHQQKSRTLKMAEQQKVQNFPGYYTWNLKDSLGIHLTQI